MVDVFILDDFHLGFDFFPSEDLSAETLPLFTVLPESLNSTTIRTIWRIEESNRQSFVEIGDVNFSPQ